MWLYGYVTGKNSWSVFYLIFSLYLDSYYNSYDSKFFLPFPSISIYPSSAA